MNSQARPLPLTADDWGMSPGINAAILEMAQRGLIQQVSILAGSPFVKHGLDELLKVPHLKFGLHFNLTLFPPLFEEQQDAFSPFMDPASFHYKPFWKLRMIWANPFGRSAKIALATDACKGQLEKLRSLKVPVSYLDGHQEVHTLPGLFPAIASELKKWGVLEICVTNPWGKFFSGKFFQARCAFKTARLARALGFAVRKVYQPSLHQLRRPSRSQNKTFVVRPSVSNDLENYGIRDRYRQGRVMEYEALNQLAQSLN